MKKSSKVALNSAIVCEIFSGIQGEGVLVGFRQIFVRFHGCNLACAYCDTPASRAESPTYCHVETRAGSRLLEPFPNPLCVDQLFSFVQRLDADYPHHSVSLTGGEPLLHSEFIDELLPLLHVETHRSFLETNGVLTEAFESLTIVPHFIAVDIKLPSASGIEPQWDQHAAFLDAVANKISRRDGGFSLPDRLQVKIVISEGSLPEIEKAASVIANCRRDIPCILQPVTAHTGGSEVPPGPETVLEAQRLASSLLTDVRVIPQTHVLLGQW